MIKGLVIILTLLLIGCSKKSEPIVKKDVNLTTPVQCMALNELGIEKNFIKKLHSLYAFDEHCDLKLTLKYKKNIVCNSPYNPNRKNVSQFPKSFLNLELRRGFKIEYSYYIDLYNNVDEGDIEDAMLRLKKDLEVL